MTKINLTVSSDGSPSGDPGGRPGVEDAACRRQTHRPDVVGELNRWGQLQQTYVVVVRSDIVVRMVDDPDHCPGLLVQVQELLVLTSEVNGEVEREGAEKQKKTTCLNMWQTHKHILDQHKIQRCLFKPFSSILF